MAISHMAIQKYIQSIKNVDDLSKGMTIARERMVDDAPELTSVVTEIAGHYCAGDAVAVRFALQGAGVLRALHIGVDRQLAAAE